MKCTRTETRNANARKYEELTKDMSHESLALHVSTWSGILTSAKILVARNPYFHFMPSRNVAAGLLQNEDVLGDNKEGYKRILNGGKFIGASVLIFCAATAFTAGFLAALSRSKKQLRIHLKHSTTPHDYLFALKAFGVGSLAAFSSVSAVVFAARRFFDVSDVSDRLPKVLPRKNRRSSYSSSSGRNDFANLQELAEYLIEEDQKKT
ncbi:unnamed protein product [Soboliphyme baturini]|uniref:Transmembrane protein 242 n=1 Tax=Soboliphyme baturini TaxID=241478 RepID=A0A183J0M6_9BILA|nr:unnamed protein product [Soboliphyme baturini]